MGKIILNDIEYGIGISNGVNVDTTNLVEKDSIVTTLDENVTDEQVPSAKAVHTAIQNVSAGVPADVYSKTEIDNLLDTKADTDAIIDAYNKTEVDDLLADKANATDIVDAYSKDEVDNLLTNKADTDDIIDSYSKDEVNTLLTGKANTSDIIDAYSKTEVDTLLTGKADSTDIIDAYTKTEIDNLLANKADSSAIEEAKTELENEITNIPKVTKTSELTNDSGFITANDIPEVDLSAYALKTQIPTTLPASDVYAWAKQATKPTYTASEVGAIPTSASCNKNWHWNGQSGQPTWVWGGEEGMDMYVYNPLNWTVNKATYASDGSHIANEITNLKNTVVDGKTSVANAINGKLGTTLSNQTSFADMAYYINSISSSGAIQKNYILATTGSISQKIKIAVMVVRASSQTFTLEFASAMSGFMFRASHVGISYDSGDKFINTTTQLSKTVSNTTVIIIFDEPVAISSITCSSDCRGIFIY